LFSGKQDKIEPVPKIMVLSDYRILELPQPVLFPQMSCFGYPARQNSPKCSEKSVFFQKNLQIKHKTLDENFKLKYCTGEQDIFLSIMCYGVSRGEAPKFTSLGILPFSSACLISPPTIIVHLIISPGISRGNKRVVCG
jgi:hypothetical protein